MEERRNVKNLTDEGLTAYEQYLREEERNRAMVEKHLRDMKKFRDYICGRGSGGFGKELVLEYRQYLNKNYKITDVNSVLAAVNSLFDYPGCGECKIKLFKIQRVQLSEKEKELTERGYERLARTTGREGGIWMSMLLQAIGNTGVRISELWSIMVETLEKGRTEIHNKGRSRVALLPMELVKVLKRYCRKVGTRSRNIFITRDGELMDKDNISKRMKVLGREAGVDTAKIFLHNFRCLFARVFYSVEKDMVRLVGLLGHPSISTTRIYAMGTEEQPRRQMSRMRMVLSWLEMAIRRKKVKDLIICVMGYRNQTGKGFFPYDIVYHIRFRKNCKI